MNHNYAAKLNYRLAEIKMETNVVYFLTKFLFSNFANVNQFQLWGHKINLDITSTFALVTKIVWIIKIQILCQLKVISMSRL